MHDHLTIGGWIFMVCAWGGIVLLNIYCFALIFREKKEEIVEPIPDLDSADSET
jgi:hypothetical protein